MKQPIILFAFSVVVMISVSSCQRVYTMATGTDPITQVPVGVKEKGDISLEASYETFDAENSYGFDAALGYSVKYNFLEVSGLNFLGHYAVNDEFSVGLGYKFNANDPYKGHLFTPSVNFFRNYPTRRGNATFGFDILAGLQFKTAKNFLTVDEILYSGYYIFEDYTIGDTFEIPIPGVDYTIEKYPLGVYSIQQRYLRPFIQPSFSVEHKYVSFHIGGNFGIMNQFRFSPALEEKFVEFMMGNDYSNPLVYYKENKTFAMGEAFLALGVGPEYCRVMFRYGNGFSSDRYQFFYYHFGVGLNSNLSTKGKSASPGEATGLKATY